MRRFLLLKKNKNADFSGTFQIKISLYIYLCTSEGRFTQILEFQQCLSKNVDVIKIVSCEVILKIRQL